MKQITVATITTKEGDNQYGHWVNHHIKDADGNSWATFADEEKTITAGAVLDVEPKMKDGMPVIKDNRMEFGKFTIVAAGAPAPQSNGTNGDDPAKRLSIERQSSAATVLGYAATIRAAGGNISMNEQATLYKAFDWLDSRFDDVPATDTRPITITQVPTPEELQRALTQTDKDWKDPESAGSGLDVAWAVNAATRLGWKTTTTLHSWLHSQGIPPVEGETMEEIFANIPGNKVAIIQAAIETRLKEKGG